MSLIFKIHWCSIVWKVMLLAWAWYIKKLNTDATFCMICVNSVWKCLHAVPGNLNRPCSSLLIVWCCGILRMPWNVWCFQNRLSRDNIPGKHWLKTECRASFKLTRLSASCIDVHQHCMSAIHQLLRLTAFCMKMLVVATVWPPSSVFLIAVSTFDEAKFSHGPEIWRNASLHQLRCPLAALRLWHTPSI